MHASTDPVSQQLGLYEESWKTDHEEVTRKLWRFEENLAVGLALFKVIHDRYWTWRERVVRGIEEYDPRDEQELRQRFVSWLRPCSEVTRRLEDLESQYGPVEGGWPFRRLCLEAQQILETWKRPVPASSPKRPATEERAGVAAHASRALTAEQLAEELDRASMPASESVPLKHPPDYTKAF